MFDNNNERRRDRSEMPIAVEDLAALAGVPPAFVRLAIDCGCPAENGFLSYISLTGWLFRHYEVLRSAAALPALPPIDALDEHDRTEAGRRNTLRTMIDYRESRCSDPETKRSLREWSMRIAAGEDY